MPTSTQISGLLVSALFAQAPSIRPKQESEKPAPGQIDNFTPSQPQQEVPKPVPIFPSIKVQVPPPAKQDTLSGELQVMKGDVERSASQIGGDVIEVQKTITKSGGSHHGMAGAFEYSGSGYYIFPNDTGYYFWTPQSELGTNNSQALPNGIRRSIYYTGGNITSPDGTTKTYKAAITTNGGITWTADGNYPKWSYDLAKNDLIPNGDGISYYGFSKNSNTPPDPHTYLLEPDGSIWRTTKGQNEQLNINNGETYENGKWMSRSPGKGTVNLYDLKGIPLTDGTWLYTGPVKYSYKDSMYVLNNGRILMLTPHKDDTKVYTYDNGNWTNIGNRMKRGAQLYPDKEISNGIKAILDSRTKRGWVSTAPPPLPEVVYKPKQFLNTKIFSRVQNQAMYCHDGFRDKNEGGFKLSLYGYDPSTDFYTLTRDRKSLLLRDIGGRDKPLEKMDEATRKRFEEWFKNPSKK